MNENVISYTTFRQFARLLQKMPTKDKLLLIAKPDTKDVRRYTVWYRLCGKYNIEPRATPKNRKDYMRELMQRRRIKELLAKLAECKVRVETSRSVVQLREENAQLQKQITNQEKRIRNNRMLEIHDKLTSNLEKSPG